jgi:hypothetical protein
MQQRYEVELIIESDGGPEEDRCTAKIVEAPNGHAAVEVARDKVRVENPDVSHLKIWCWNRRRIYT